jgi:hypothetical protein
MSWFIIVGIIVITILAITSMILAITVSSYYWIAFGIHLIFLSIIIYFWIKNKSKLKNSSGILSSSVDESESSLDAY